MTLILSLSLTILLLFTPHSFAKTTKEECTMSVLDNGRPFALHYDVSLMAKWPPNVSGWHSSIVTGREWNETIQTCEIIIKNSWGENCELSKVKKACNKGIWRLSTEMLANSKSEVIWIEK